MKREEFHFSSSFALCCVLFYLLVLPLRCDVVTDEDRESFGSRVTLKGRNEWGALPTQSAHPRGRRLSQNQTSGVIPGICPDFSSHFTRIGGSNYLGNDNNGPTLRTLSKLGVVSCLRECALDCECNSFVITNKSECILKTGQWIKNYNRGYSTYTRDSDSSFESTDVGDSQNLLTNPGFDYTSVFQNSSLNITSNLSNFVYGWDLIQGQATINFGNKYPIDNYLSLCTLDTSSVAQITQTFATEPNFFYTFKFYILGTTFQKSMSIQVNFSTRSNYSVDLKIDSDSYLLGPIQFVADKNSTKLTVRGFTQKGSCVSIDSLSLIKDQELILFANSPSNSSSSSIAPNNSKTKIIVIAIVISVFILVVIFICVFFLVRKRKPNLPNGNPEDSLPKVNNSLFASLQRDMCKEFSLIQIMNSTNEFDESNMIGKGGFSIVYKGVDPNGGQAWAIKRLTKKKLGHHKEPEFSHGVTKIEEEVRFLSKIYHNNLVRLLGYHFSKEERILVYEFMEKGSLRKVLNSDVYLSWDQRLEIANGIAQGLNYLHNHTQPQIIHRDIKSDNVLLDEEFQAKITDFGLMKMNENKHSFLMSTPMGTIGYVDPEYARTGALTTKSDVYSFGMILLELVTRRHSVEVKDSNSLVTDKSGKRKLTLLSWIKASLELENLETIQAQELETILDPQLKDLKNDSIEMSSMCQFVALAAQCLRRSSKERPDIIDVCSAIHRIRKDRISSRTITVKKIKDGEHPDTDSDFYEKFANSSAQGSESFHSGAVGPAMSQAFETR